MGTDRGRLPGDRSKCTHGNTTAQLRASPCAPFPKLHKNRHDRRAHPWPPGDRFRFWNCEITRPHGPPWGCRPRRSASSCRRVGRSPRTRSVPDGIPTEDRGNEDDPPGSKVTPMAVGPTRSGSISGLTLRLGVPILTRSGCTHLGHGRRAEREFHVITPGSAPLDPACSPPFRTDSRRKSDPSPGMAIPSIDRDRGQGARSPRLGSEGRTCDGRGRGDCEGTRTSWRSPMDPGR